MDTAGVSSKKRRIGILTGGGDCPGLNPVIRAVVKRGVSQLGWEIIGVRESFRGLVRRPLDVVELHRDTVRGILSKGGTILRTANGANPFAFPVKNPDGTMRYEDRSAELVDAMRILELEGLIAVGGDGTLRTADLLRQIGVKVVCVPKTIDNDIFGTDYTFGFHTAVEVATEAIDRLHSTAESHDRVMVVEVMGRDCGWIALHAGIAGGADVVLVPEIPYDMQRVCDKIRRRQAAGRSFSIVVVAEGAMEQGQGVITLDTGGPGGRKPRLGGCGAHVARMIEQRTGVDCRVTVLGHVQRGGSAIGFDRLLATRFGMFATDLVDAGRWGEMAALRGTEMVGVPIAEAAGRLKRIDPNGELVAVARKLGIEVGTPEAEPELASEPTPAIVEAPAAAAPEGEDAAIDAAG